MPFRNYEQAIIACKELGDLRDVSMLAQKSCYMYQQHGSCDSGAAVLDKGAKILEGQFPEQALQLYQQAIDVVMVKLIPCHLFRPNQCCHVAVGG